MSEKPCKILETCSTWEEYIAKKVGAPEKRGAELAEYLSEEKNKVGEFFDVQGFVQSRSLVQN